MIHTTDHTPDITVIRPGVDRLTAANAKTFKEEVSGLIANGANQLIVDFGDVTFLDSSGLGALVGILKKIGHRGDLVVCGLGAEAAHMFKICRMERVFTVYPDVDTAVRKMSETA
jgi:anti-sigma B factor antagonist